MFLDAFLLVLGIGIRYVRPVLRRYAVTYAVQVDDDGESYWVFESRDVSNPVP
jgi:hypothetical protein